MARAELIVDGNGVTLQTVNGKQVHQLMRSSEYSRDRDARRARERIIRQLASIPEVQLAVFDFLRENGDDE